MSNEVVENLVANERRELWTRVFLEEYYAVRTPTQGDEDHKGAPTKAEWRRGARLAGNAADAALGEFDKRFVGGPQ